MKIMITGLLAIVVMASSALAGNADTRANLMTLFSDRHYVPNSAAIKGAGEDVPSTLQNMTNDKSLLTFIRIRAVNALQFFASADVSEFLRATASRSTTQAGIRSEAITALSSSGGDSTTKFIAGFLSDNDVLLKSSAAHSLRQIGSAEAKTALREAGRAKDNKAPARVKPLD